MFKQRFETVDIRIHSEFMADEGLFIEFVDKLKDPANIDGIDNAEAWYYHIMKLADQLKATSSRAKLLRFALSMRLYSPKVHLHQQVCIIGAVLSLK